MNVFPISNDIVSGIKRRLVRGQRKSGKFQSAHISEALAAGLGYKSHAALLSSIKLDKSFGYATFDNDLFDERLSDLTGLEMPEIYSILMVTPFSAIHEQTGFVPGQPELGPALRGIIDLLDAKLHEIMLNMRGASVEELVYRLEVMQLGDIKIGLVLNKLGPRIPARVNMGSGGFSRLVEDEIGAFDDERSDFYMLATEVAEEARHTGALRIDISFSVFTGVTYKTVIGQPDGTVETSTFTLYTDSRQLERAIESMTIGVWERANQTQAQNLSLLDEELRNEIIQISDRSRSHVARGLGYLLKEPGRGKPGEEIITKAGTFLWESWRPMEGDEVGRQVSAAALAALHSLDFVDQINPSDQSEGAKLFILNGQARRAVRYLREARPQLFDPQAKPKDWPEMIVLSR